MYIHPIMHKFVMFKMFKTHVVKLDYLPKIACKATA